MKAKKPSFVYLVAAIALSVFFAIVFYPGWMSNDSCVQYAQSLTGHYNSKDPFMMAWWWRCLNFLHKGPGLFLIQNQLCYWLGLGLIALHVHRKIGYAALLVLFAGLFPSAIIITAQIWKDVVFTSLAVLSLGMILYFYDYGVRLVWQIALILPVFVLAYGCKPNGLPVVVFLVVVWMFRYASGIGRKVRVVSACGLMVVIMALPPCLGSLLSVERVSAMQYIQSHDLLAMGIMEGRLLLPDWMVARTGITVKTAPQFHYTGGNNLFFYNTKAGDLTSHDSLEIEALHDKWLFAISRYPMTYFKMRWKYFVSLIRFGWNKPGWIVEEGSMPNDWGIGYKSNFISRALLWTTKKLPCLYLPWIYLLLSALMTLPAVFFRDELWRLILIVGICGALFSSPHYFVGPDADFRYLHFPVVCMLIQFAVLGGMLLKRAMCLANRHREQVRDCLS